MASSVQGERGSADRGFCLKRKVVVEEEVQLVAEEEEEGVGDYPKATRL